MEDILASALADDEPRVEESAEPQAEAPEAEPQAPEQPASEEAPQPEQPQPSLDAPVLDHKPEPGFVPIAVMLDARDRAKAAEAELQRYRAQQAQPVTPPDMFEDPDAYRAFQNEQVEARLYQQQLTMSERLARLEHGAETVQKAKEWGLSRCDADPFFNARVRAAEDPYGVVLEEYRREQTAGIDQTEFAQFQAWKAAQAPQPAQQQQAAPAVAPQQQRRNIPPPSLAAAPSNSGGGSIAGGESILEAALRD